FWKGDLGTLCILNECVPVGTQCRDREGHGNSVIMLRLNLRSVQRLLAGNIEAIFMFDYFRTHCAEVACDGADPVGFFHAQFARVANFDSFLCVGRNSSKHWQLIDQGGGLATRDLYSTQLAVPNLYRADQFAVMVLKIEHIYSRTKRSKDIQNGAS